MDDTELRLRCLELAEGNVGRAQELYDFAVNKPRAADLPSGGRIYFCPATETRWSTVGDPTLYPSLEAAAAAAAARFKEHAT